MAMVSGGSPPSAAFENASFFRLVSRPFDIRRPAAVEVLTILLVCALDMYSTIYWVRTGMATEANPFLAWTFHLHPVVFVLIKAATFVPTLLLAAYMARRHPRTVTLLLRFVILAYLAIYAVGIL